MKLKTQAALKLAYDVLTKAGASDAVATSIAAASASAERFGRTSCGMSHLLDYIHALDADRLLGNANPDISYPTPASIKISANSGCAQLGFDLVFDEVIRRTQQFGLALFLQSDSYTAGELSYYTRRLAAAGLVSFAATNGPAKVVVGTAKRPVYGTNPFSFSASADGHAPLVTDQATSATAFVNLRTAANNGSDIPFGWATDATGKPTQDAHEALNGMLLTFGGQKGANLALMVEVLAAGMTDANWSMDVPAFDHGNRSPGTGLFVLTLQPDILAEFLQALGGANFSFEEDGDLHPWAITYR